MQKLAKLKPTMSKKLPHIQLLPFEENHFDVLTRWIMSHEEHVKWTGPVIPYPITRQQLQESLKESHASPPARHCWMAVNENGEHMGHLQLVLDRTNRVGRLARIIVAPEHRGKGYARELVRQALDHAFLTDNLERVELNVYPQNTAAVKTYQRLGFREEGLRRSSAQVGDQRWDTMIMGLLKHEWIVKP